MMTKMKVFYLVFLMIGVLVWKLYDGYSKNGFIAESSWISAGFALVSGLVILAIVGWMANRRIDKK